MSLLFVYGTLRRDLGRRCPPALRASVRRLHREGRFIGRGWTRGRLISPDVWPGLIAGDDKVRGEVWRVAPALLAALDDYEGEAYARTPILVRRAGGHTLRAQTWLWMGSTRYPTIPSGDYLAWLRSGRRRASASSS